MCRTNMHFGVFFSRRTGKYFVKNVRFYHRGIHTISI